MIHLQNTTICMEFRKWNFANEKIPLYKAFSIGKLLYIRGFF